MSLWKKNSTNFIFWKNNNIELHKFLSWPTEMNTQMQISRKISFLDVNCWQLMIRSLDATLCIWDTAISWPQTTGSTSFNDQMLPIICVCTFVWQISDFRKPFSSWSFLVSTQQAPDAVSYQHGTWRVNAASVNDQFLLDRISGCKWLLEGISGILLVLRNFAHTLS